MIKQTDNWTIQEYFFGFVGDKSNLIMLGNNNKKYYAQNLKHTNLTSYFKDIFHPTKEELFLFYMDTGFNTYPSQVVLTKAEEIYKIQSNIDRMTYILEV